MLIPSIWFENLPTTGLNAIASGVPVITSDVGGLTELVEDYRCGYTYAADDPAALAALLVRLAGERDELARLRETLTLPPSLEEEAWRVEDIYTAALGAGVT